MTLYKIILWRFKKREQDHAAIIIQRSFRKFMNKKICVICHNSLCNITISCNHKYHYECMRKYVKEYSSIACPICRKKLTYKDFTKVNYVRSYPYNDYMYTGDWYSKPNGFGKLYDYSGKYVYTGMFKNGKRHGYGKEKTLKNIYEGQWVNNKKHGNGTYYIKDGNIWCVSYIGKWKYNITHSKHYIN